MGFGRVAAGGGGLGIVGLIEDLTQADINAALDTAGRIGDDWIQSHLGSGQVDRSSFTHGSSVQRKKWFGNRLPRRRSERLQHLRREQPGLRR